MANKVKKILVFTMMLFVGISSVLASTKNISVTNIEVKDKSGTITVVDPVFESNEVKSNITFNQIDDFVTFELTLKNNESEKYKITSITDNNTNENIKVEYSFNKDFINTGDTSKVTLKLTYKNKLLNVDEISLNDLTITLNLESEEGKEEEIIINPVTGDNIFHYLVLLIIALVGIGLVVAKKKVKGIKVGSFFVVLAVLLLPFAVFANEKYEITIKFDDIKVKGEFETYNISIDPGNGAPVETRQITYGDKIGTLPANPTKDGYTFNKWVDNDGNEVTEDTVITGPIEIIATYNLITYNITYDLDEGSLPSGKSNPDKYTIESQSITLNNPEKQGYTFAGWSGTGIDGQTTEVTIDHGSKGDRSYKAHYLANDDTKYTVIHKFQKSTEGYDEETVEEHGTTGSTVPAPRKTRTGFITPAVQNVTIEADESASVTYVYDRETYAFSITDRTYVDSTSTADGTYPYGTSITVKAVNRPGYDFKWSDGDTNLERTFTLEEPMNLTPEYTARTDTAYKVIHQKQKITLDGYEIEDTQNLTGKTDSPISPAVNTYEGFTSPAVQSTTINGDGSTVVNYYYTRNQVTVTFTNTEYIEEDVTSGLHYYEEQITLTAKDRDGYTFTGWTNGETSNSLTITVGTSDISVGPEYTAKTNTPYVVNHYKMNLDGENYTKVEDDTQNLTGTTDATITPAVNTYDGFTSPSTQTTTISGKGDTVVNYYYTRNKYTLTINHPEYLEEDKSGDYYYEEEITLTAIDRQGYTFAGWNTGETTKTITVSMPVDGITEEATYTSNTDTTYSVTHKYKKLTEGYDEVTINGTGTTGDTIEAPLRPQTGFVNPTVQNITIAADGQASVTYIYDRETYAFSITNRTYLDSTSTANGTYPYGTEITLKAQERTGYTFKWSDDVTDLERTFELAEATTLSLVYTADTYTLTADANEGTIEETTGWTGTGATATKTITYDSTYGTLPTVKRTGYTFTGWTSIISGIEVNISEDTTVFTTTDQTITANWSINSYTVSFDVDGGSTVPSQTVSYGSTATRPTTDPTKTGYTFDDWYTTDQYTTKFDFANTAITGDTTIYAHFEELKVCVDNENITRLSENTCSNNENITIGDGIVCKRAVKLHEETCSYTDGTNFCSGAGYTTSGSKGTDTITYGSCGTSGTLSSGDAFTCDVNGDGNFDELTERFYYVSDYYDTSEKEFDTSTAVLIYYNDVTSGVSCNKNTYAYSSKTDIQTVDPSITDYDNRHGPLTVMKQLPTTSQWSNVSLKSETRAILGEEQSTHDSPTTLVGTLPTDFSYEGYAARLLTAKELMAGCNLTEVGRFTRGELDSCNYIMENTRYAKSSIGSFGHWLETPRAFDTRLVWLVSGQERTVYNRSVNDAKYYGGARPAIEVPKTAIDIGSLPQYTVSFDTDGGSEIASQTVSYGSTATRPATDPEKTGFVFDDWYTTDQYTTKFDFENTAITEDTTIYAKFDELKTCAENENITKLSENTCSNNENITVGDGIVCKRAVKLHEETCSQTSGDYYCSGAGYTESGSKGTSTITYGSCGTSGTLSSGDAFTCDVNGDGDFDELTERFYYVSDYYDTSAKGFDTSTAVLIYYNNVTSGVSCNKNTFAYDSSNENWHGPRTLVSQLPTTSQWSNVSLKSDTRAILAEYQSTHDSPTTGGETLPTNFSYEGYAARLLTAKELMSGCNLTEVGRKTTGELDSCNYIMENTRYAKSTIGSSGHWLETPYAFDTYSVWYVGGYYHSVHSSSTNNSNFGSARPVIEVPKTAIDIGSLPQYTVSFNSDGGSTIADIEVDAGDSINELPTPTKADSVFVGWFESVTDENPVSEPYTPSGDITLIAKWNNIICKKATTLHTETCNQTNGSKYCSGDGYAVGDTITYGNIVSSDTYEAGDAFDCDVDGTGYNQRFYYLRTKDNKAVLISNKNFTAASKQADQNISFIYSQAHDQLPTTSDWGNLPVKFDGKPARLITMDDLLTVIGASEPSDITPVGSLKGYEFLFESSNFSGIGERSTQWLEEISSTERYRYRNDQYQLAQVESGKENSSKNPVRPVIEVPTDLIEDAYVVKFDANGGNTTSEYAKVIKGNSLGTLPTATREGYIFDGWYTSFDFTIPVTENTVPNGYVTYYAKWTGDIQDATFAHDSFILSVGDEDDIVINNSSDYESVTYTSNDTSIVTVNNSGHLTAVDDGETTITVTGSKSGHTRTISVKVTEEITDFVVHFDSMGGSSVDDMFVPINTAIGSFPEDPELADNIFAGWYTNTNYSTKVTTDTVIRSDVTFYAKWIPENAVAEINHTYFTSLQSAFDSEMTGKTTIILLKDISVQNTYLDLYTKNFGKDIVLDLNGHTITGSGKQTLRTKTSLEIKNGTITQSSSNGTIDVGEGGHLIMNNGTIVNSGSRAAIYNDGGTVELGGTVYATSNAVWASNQQRGTVQNKSGTTIITGGTYINTGSSNSYAVSSSVGTLTIGTKDDIYNTTNIVLQGETSGIYSAVDYSIYDGMIRGKSSAVNNESKITSIEDNATKVNDVDGDYNILYYTVPNNKYRIDLDAGEGTVDPTYILVDAGDQLGTLPTPTRGIYTFDGWFDSNDVEADPTHEPTSSETYYAKWHYEASNEIVEFRTTNDAMAEYYDKIETWKVSSANFPSWSSSNKSPDWALDAIENTAMKNNFDANNCQCADGQCSSSGTVACDKPKGYSTGINEKVNVYLSDAVTKAKGDLVTYAKADNGIIYNLIPGEVYYWESDNDENIHGYVKFTGERRILDTGDVRNTRDLGGLPVDTDGDNIPDGELKYGKLFRGIKLNSSSSVTELANLGITEELDLRESNSDPYKLSDIDGKKYHRIEAQNYYVNYNPDNATEMGYYNMTRAAVKYAMEEIVNGENLYFHCRIGTDRTGTVAYVLEGLLGVPEEDRVQDYELSFFYGLIRIHRYHNEKPGSTVGTGKERFVYMHNFMPTNSDIYDWYMAGSDDPTGDADLINRFRTAMIDTN